MTAQPLAEPLAFGDRYRLTELLAVGGMAEIYLARQDSPGGFDKEVVIKRLKPQLAGDSRILDMFMDEARIGGLVCHPNTVHVYDVGEHQGVPFIAMEYIPGEELNDLCRRGLGAGAFLPLELAVDLMRQAALSLGHFHAARDRHGRELGIVHCDISPTNLLVTVDGFLKVIDFGIARFRDQRYRDQAAVPGKLSYMSPEQARREALDHRSDIFSLGIVLYEITLGRRLFRGPASEVIERLTRCQIQPPTFVQNDYPGGLEAAVMRALEASPADRYQSAFDLADDLERFLLEIGRPTGPVAVARYIDELAVAAGGERRPELVSESEGGDDDALDFDRGWEATGAPGVSVAAAEWDEFEEDEQAVADALGIDVRLVRTPTQKPARGAAPRRPAADPEPIEPPEAAEPADAAGDEKPAGPDAEAPIPAISPLPAPSPLRPFLIGAVAGGLIAFLILHLLS